jgi:hypothetical protein
MALAGGPGGNTDEAVGTTAAHENGGAAIGILFPEFT